MRKLTSVLLILIMVLCMGTTVFADDTPTTNLTINNSEGRTYNGYQLLTLTTSLKCDHAEGVAHEAACYNYAYTVNSKYEDILQAQAGENNDIIEYLNGLSSDTADGYGTLRPVADSIYREILKAGIEADAKGLQGTGNINQGYWLIADTTNLGAAYNANSLVMVNTKGQDTLTITPKTALPQLEKKVKDINDSTDDAIADNAWADSADHDKGDTVPFKLTATVPDVTGYAEYKMVFHDTMEAGLTLDPDSFKVYLYPDKDTAGADYDLDGKDSEGNLNGGKLIESYDVKTDNDKADETCSFELILGNILEIEGVEAGTAFVVYYEATLNENAVMGSTGNSNTAYLEFSNNPYTDGTGKTPEDKVKVFTYQLKINKVDDQEEPQPLKGAGFTLYKKHKIVENDEVKYVYKAVGKEVKGENITTFTWDRLDDGDYKLVETTIPAGYNKMDDVEFTISATHDADAADPALRSLSGGLASGTIDTGKGLFEAPVTNYTGTVLPSTGAQGTMVLIGGGSVLIVLAAVFMITRKKMSIYED